MEQDPNAQRLRAAFKRRRAELGHRTDVAFAEAAGIPYRTLVNLLQGKSTRIEDAVELHLGWSQGSVGALRAGGEATVTATNPAPGPEVDGASVGASDEDAEEILFRLPPGLTPRQRETARTLGRQSIETYLDSLKE